MNRPSLRAAFGDKHEIYIKALNDYWELKFAALGRAFEKGGTLAETLTRVYDAALSIYFSGGDQVPGCFVVSTAITEAVGDRQIQHIVAEGFHKIDADFEACFELARAAGALKQGSDPKTLALLASATMHTLAIRARAGTSRSDLRKLAQKAVSLICA